VGVSVGCCRCADDDGYGQARRLRAVEPTKSALPLAEVGDDKGREPPVAAGGVHEKRTVGYSAFCQEDFSTASLCRLSSSILFPTWLRLPDRSLSSSSPAEAGSTHAGSFQRLAPTRS
jgi:hypothetical protein